MDSANIFRCIGNWRIRRSNVASGEGVASIIIWEPPDWSAPSPVFGLRRFRRSVGGPGLAIGRGTVGLSGSVGGSQREADWRARFLIHAVNNVRFLVLPWVRVRHLASAVLGQGLSIAAGLAPSLRRAGVAGGKLRGPPAFRRGLLPGGQLGCIGWTRGYAKQQGVSLSRSTQGGLCLCDRTTDSTARLGDPVQALLTRIFSGPAPPETPNLKPGEPWLKRFEPWHPRCLRRGT